MDSALTVTAAQAAHALRAGGIGALVIEVGSRAQLEPVLRALADLRSPPPVVIAAQGETPEAASPRDELITVDAPGGVKRLIRRHSVLYGRAVGDYVRIVCADGRYMVHGRISEMAGRWDRFGFLQTHRRFVVNTGKVREIHPSDNGTASLVLEGGERVPISRRRLAGVRAALTS